MSSSLRRLPRAGARLFMAGVAVLLALPMTACSPEPVVSTDAATWRPWICAWSDKEVDAQPMTIETDAGVVILDSRVLCWRAAEVKTDPVSNPLSAAAVDAFLARNGMSLEEAREGQLAAVLCHDGAVGSSSVLGGLPGLDQVKEACTRPTVPAGAGGALGGSGGDREGGLLPGLSGAGAGMPSSSSISCSASGANNPWGDGADGGVPRPRTSDAEIAGTLTASWFTGVAAMFGMAKGAGSASTGAGGVLATGAGTAAIVAWGTAAATALGNLMDARYRDQAQALADDAAHWAQAAEASAQAAESLAAASGDPTAQQEAAKARQAADDAKKAAAEAAAAAKRAADAKTRAEAAAAHAAAKKADEEAKKKANESGKAQQAAQNAANNSSSSGVPVNPGSGSAPSTNGTPMSTGESTCETLRHELWECEQNGWRNFGCQELARMLQRCAVDMEVALVDGDGAVCGGQTVSSEQVVAALGRACGMEVAHPLPGVDPCALTVDGSPEIRGACDPTVAYNGCPDQPDVVVEGDDTICFPAPPGAPPMPCVDPTPGGGPLVGGILQDPFGGVYVATSGGMIFLGDGYPPHPRRGEGMPRF